MLQHAKTLDTVLCFCATVLGKNQIVRESQVSAKIWPYSVQLLVRICSKAFVNYKQSIVRYGAAQF